jgi:hypothetical protein
VISSETENNIMRNIGREGIPEIAVPACRKGCNTLIFASFFVEHTGGVVIELRLQHHAGTSIHFIPLHFILY